jgi:hypothetical protein
LLKAIGRRGTSAGFDTVLGIYKAASGEERGLAGEALQRIAQPGHEGTLISFLKDNIPNRTDLENGIVSLLRQNPDLSKRAAPVLGEMEQATGDYRKSLFRIACQTGGAEVLSRFSRLTKDKGNDTGLLSDLVMGLARWPDRSASGLTRDLMGSEHPEIAAEASRAYIRMLSIPGGGDDTGNWKFVLEKAERGDALSIFETMADRPTAQTLNFLKSASSSGWERTFQQAQKSAEDAAAAAIPVASGKIIPAQAAKPRGEPEAATYVEDGSYWDWKSPSGWFIWILNFSKPGNYKVEVLAAAEAGGGSDLIVSIGKQQLTGKSVATKTKTAFEPANLSGGGMIQIKPEDTGIQVLGLMAGPVTKPKILNLNGIRLTAK